MKPFSDEDDANIRAWHTTVGDATHNLDVPAVLVECGNETEWLDARRGGIGASEVGVIMGASKWTSPYALWWMKKLDWRIPTTEAQMWGHLVEDPIIALFAQQMSESLYVAKPRGHPYSLWTHPDKPWIMCTPDRLAVLPDGRIVPVEVKSDEAGPGWGTPETDEVPEQYAWQAQWQALVFGAHGTYVVRKRASGRRRMVWYWVPFDYDMVGSAVSACQQFLTSISGDVPPEPDGSSATTDALQSVNALEPHTFADVPVDLAAEWVDARENKRHAAAAERFASNKLRAAMGRAEYATWKTSDGLDLIFAKRRIGKRAGYEVAPTTTDELRQVNDGHSTPDAAVPPAHPETAPPNSSEGAGGQCVEGGAMGAAAEEPGNPWGIEDVTQDEIEDVIADSRADPETIAAVVAELPPELATLVQRALDEGGPMVPPRVT